MKRIIGILLLVVATVGTASAGERAGAFSISPFAGGYTYDGEQHMRTRPVYGIRLGYDLTDAFATEGVFDYVAGETTTDHRDLNAFSYRLDLLYNFFPATRIVPYLAVGGGGITIEDRDTGHGDTSATVNAGGGLKFFLTESVALRTDARYLLLFEGNDNSFNNVEYTLGMSFLFGGAPRAAAAAAAVPPPPVTAPAAPAPPKAAPPAPAPAPERVKYCISLKTEFDIDKADIRPEYEKDIDRVADFMRKYPTTTAVIEGHTDEVGSDEYNMQLSQRRAESVVNYLVDKAGIDRSRLSAKGFGKTRPIADNTTEEGKQKNRRIDAIIDCAIDLKQITPPPERLCVSLNIQFDTAKADIKPEYEGEISKVAEYMKKYPTTTALIEGHTDTTGTPEGNMKLSQERAESVVNFLVNNFGIDRSRLSAKGYGDTRRIAYNDTEEGRAKNRRIDAVIDCVLQK